MKFPEFEISIGIQPARNVIPSPEYYPSKEAFDEDWGKAEFECVAYAQILDISKSSTDPRLIKKRIIRSPRYPNSEYRKAIKRMMQSVNKAIQHRLKNEPKTNGQQNPN